MLSFYSRHQFILCSGGLAIAVKEYFSPKHITSNKLQIQQLFNQKMDNTLMKVQALA